MGGEGWEKTDKLKTHDDFNLIFPSTGNIRGSRSDSP